MKIISLILVCAAASVACSVAQSTPTTVAVRATPSPSPSVSATPMNSPEMGATPLVSPSPTPVDPPREITSGKDGTSNTSSGNSLNERLQGRKPIVDHKGPVAPLEFRPAAENSQIATTMDAQGRPVEVRVFKGDQRLERVEATWLDARQKLLKIMLRSGKVVEVKTDKIANLASAKASELATLASASNK